MIDTDRKHAVDKMTSSSGIFDHLHPQANAFFQLFPQPDGSISLATIFAKQFQQLWNEKFKDQPWTLIGFSATKPSFDDQSAENGGNDYLCRIKVHIKDGSEEKSFYIDDLPYPNNNGEFVINGNRYFIPMFLRDNKQLQNMELKRAYFKRLKEIKNKITSESDADNLKEAVKKDFEESKKSLEEVPHERLTNNLHVILLDELLQNKLALLLEIKFREFEKSLSANDIPKQHIALNLPHVKLEVSQFLIISD